MFTNSPLLLIVFFICMLCICQKLLTYLLTYLLNIDGICHRRLGSRNALGLIKCAALTVRLSGAEQLNNMLHICNTAI